MDKKMRYYEVVEEECVPLCDDDGRLVVSGGQWRCGHRHMTRQSASFCREYNGHLHPHCEIEEVDWFHADNMVVFAHIESLLVAIAESVAIIKAESIAVGNDASCPRQASTPSLKPVKCPPNVSDVRWKYMTANHKVVEG